MELIVDSRESSIKKLLTDRGIPFKVEQLEVGDFIIRRNGKPLCIIERKTIFDYVASISDKRNKNQSIRLQSVLSASDTDKTDKNPKIIYLIETYTLEDTMFTNYGEGSLPDDSYMFHGGITGKALHTSICNKIIRDNFYVFQTTSPRDSVRFIEKLFDQYSKDSKDSKDSKANSEYLKTISLSKKENMTIENYYICALAQIPGASVDSAQVIANVYPNFPSLIGALTEHGKHVLSNLKRPDSNRRIGDILSERIHDYLVPKPKPIDGSTLVEKKQSEGAMVDVPSTKQKIKLVLKNTK